MTKLSLESVVLTMLVKRKRVALAFCKLNYNPFTKVMTNASEPPDDFSQLLLPVHESTLVASVLQPGKVVDRLVDNSNYISSSYHSVFCQEKIHAFEGKRTVHDDKFFTKPYRIDQTVLY